MARLLRRALTGVSATLFGWGKVIGAYIYIEDLARVIASVAQLDDAPPVLRGGTGIGHSTLDIVGLAQGISGLSFDDRGEPPRTVDVDANLLDITALRKRGDFAPKSAEYGMADSWTALRSSEQLKTLGARRTAHDQ